MKAPLIFLLLSLFASVAFAQNQGNQEAISGTVFSSGYMTPMKGVELTILNSGEKIYSSEEGTFSFPFDGNEVWLLMTYPGYHEQTRRISSAGTYVFYFTETSEKSVYSETGALFGNTVRFKNASYSDLLQETFAYTSEVSPELAIQGRIPGLSIKRFSGMPGEGATLNIRGISSLFASQNARVILDGVPINSTPFENYSVGGSFHNPLSIIDVNDIASVEVYKDGTALYGVDGGTGLIAINTKKPESVKTRIDFSIYTGMSFKPEYLKLMNAPQHKTYLINQLQNSGLSLPEIQQQNPWVSGNPSYYYYYNYDNNTNWQDEIFKPAYVSKYNASLEGGDEIARFYVSLGYLNQEGVTKNTGYQRYNFRFHSDVRILEKLYMTANVGFSYHTATLQSSGIDMSINPVHAALRKGPMFAPYLRDNMGNRISILSDADAYGFSNPTAIIKGVEATSFESNLVANGKLVYELRRNLNISSLLNVNINNFKEGLFVPDHGIADFNAGETRNYAREGINKISGIMNETKVSFNTRSGLSHYFSTDAGVRIRSDKGKYNSGTVFNTPTDEFKSLSSVTSVENTLFSGADMVINRSDVFLNNSYRFKDKYLFDLVLSMSSSSTAGSKADAINLAGGKWGFFPSLHAGWIISSEPFLNSFTALDLLKLRLSYSKSGNDYYTEFSRYAFTSSTYGSYSGIVRTYIPNETLKWEQISQINLGLDIIAFKERIFLSMDAFNRITNDLLTYSQLHVTSGFEYLWENNGSLTSKGIEVSALGKILNGDLKLAIGGNLSFNNTELELSHDIILDIPGGQVIASSGNNALSFYGYQTDGIISTSAEATSINLISPDGTLFQAGDVRFVEQKTDGVLDDNDKIALGDLYPDLLGGLTFDFSYHGISLNILFDFQTGNKLFNYTRMAAESLSDYGNQTVAALYSWKNEGDVTGTPATSYLDPRGNSSFSDRWIEDGTMFRLKELSLAYKFPETRAFKSLVIYLSGQNLLTISDYLGYYPEFAFSAKPAFQGTDYGQMPVTPMMVLGVKVGF